jgi:polyisoprenoid-binding protein YceI
MKKMYLFSAAVVVTAMISCTSAPDSDKAITGEAEEVTASTEGDSWKIDPSASTVKWVGTKVSSHHVGSIGIANGNLNVKDGAITGGKIVMNMKTLDVTGPKGSNPKGNEKLKGHLHSADFFDTEKYPEATFEITAITPNSAAVTDVDDPRQEEINEYKVSNPTHTVSGNLTLKDVTKNVEFPAKISMTDGTIDAIAKFNIDRSLWNITYPGQPDDLIRNEVHIGLSIKATK